MDALKEDTLSEIIRHNIPCKDILTKISTTAVVDNCERSKLNRLNVGASRKITLLQEPREIISLDVSIQKIEDDSNKHSVRYSYGLIITFENNLHEMSREYGYEINFRLSVAIKGKRQHIPLFSHKQLRTQKSLFFADRQFSMEKIAPTETDVIFFASTHLAHVCCDINRYYTGRTPMLLEQYYRQDSVGELLLKSGLYHDALLKVRDKEFQAHRDILSLHSKVFKMMFETEMLESKGTVTIKNYSPEVIEDMLLFIYTGKTKNIEKNALDLFDVAQLYEIEGLKSKCFEFILFNVDEINVIDIVDVANLYGLKNLKKCALEFLTNHEQEMVKQKSFQKFLADNLELSTIVSTLKLCAKYDLSDVKSRAFAFIKEHKQISKNEEFLKLFETHPSLMKEIYLDTLK